jgi:hypothetical protein
MSYVDTMKQIAYAHCDVAEEAIDFLESKGHAVIRAALDVSYPWQFAPGFVKDKAADVQWMAVRALIPKMRDLLAKSRRSVEYLGDPDELRARSQMLYGPATAVEGSVTEIINGMTPVMLPGNYGLEGTRKAAYDDLIAYHKEHLEAYQQPLEDISGVLIDVAASIESYYLKMAASAIAAAKLVTDLVTTILGLATVETGVGAVIAALGIVSAIADVIAALIAGLTAIVDTQHENEEKLKKIHPPVGWDAPADHLPG